MLSYKTEQSSHVFLKHKASQNYEHHTLLLPADLQILLSTVVISDQKLSY